MLGNLKLVSYVSRRRRISCISFVRKSAANRCLSTSPSDIYERKTPLEHVLLRPGMYVGQVETIKGENWVYNSSDDRMVLQDVTYSPALLKIFDEILVNAVDNSQRIGRGIQMTYIDISIDRRVDKLIISIKNDGKGIPIKIHDDEKIYIPELIFGHLLTGSNFNDDEKRFTGGRHGYGAKLTNIFSTSFELELYDHKQKLFYHQHWKNNMQISNPPEIKKKYVIENEKSYTKITFQPDLERLMNLNQMKNDSLDMNLSLDQLMDNIIQLYHRRAMDIAACMPPKITIYLNSKPLPINSFVDYVKRFAKSFSKELTEDNLDSQIFHERINPQWEIAVIRSPYQTFSHMSFVNSIWTSGGGTHVNVITTQLVKAIEEKLSSYNKRKGNDDTSITLSPSLIRNFMMIFINCKIVNPSFDSQSKHTLTSSPLTYGSTFKLSESFINRFLNESNIIQDIIIEFEAREKMKLMRLASKTASNSNIAVDVPKLEDAHYAGKSGHALDCTLILTEGDSAKALAVAGLEIIGRQKYGVMPLRGKILNARSATPSQLSRNVELMHICKAMGLDFNKTYANNDLKGLRYGKILLMCDQDNDGSHIKGLVVNFIDHFWPNLLHVEGFIQQFITPLVKVRLKSSPAHKQSNKKSRSLSNHDDRHNNEKVVVFYSLGEYMAWRKKQLKVLASKSHSNQKSKEAHDDINRYNIKYYKGLGTNTAAEGREYFKSLARHQILFYSKSISSIKTKTKDSNRNSNDSIDLAFNKSRVEDRRHWLLSKYDPNIFLDPNQLKVSYEEFIDNEFIHFSNSDNIRSIPSVIDGLKPSQRKVLFSCFKRNLDEDMKVVQLAGYVAEQTAYHHGEASLHSTIIRMAQDFTGSNNIPFLVPSGQFGTRAHGGKDFASPRYIYTRLSPLTSQFYATIRYLFVEADDHILDYLEEDGLKVEPKYFIPIIPTILLNGCQGIGTGWSTFIPTFHPMDIIQHVQYRLGKNSSHSTLKPWIRGFDGSIINHTDMIYKTMGVYHHKEKNIIEITELPYGQWTNAYKLFLNKLRQQEIVKEFKEFHTIDKVKFQIILHPNIITQLESSESIQRIFRLITNLSLKNMHAFNGNEKLQQYHHIDDIFHDHYQIRYQAYEKRKLFLLKKLQFEELKNHNQSRFISGIINDEIQLFHANERKPISSSIIKEQLQRMNFTTTQEFHFNDNDFKDSTESNSSQSVTIDHDLDYDYLLNMPLSSLTESKLISLQKKAEESKNELIKLQSSSVIDLWSHDLDQLVQRMNYEMPELFHNVK